MLSWRLCFSLLYLFFLSVSSISNVFVRLNSLLYFFPCFSIVVTFLIIILQGTEPEQGATAAVDASAWTTAQHFPHSALPPEREGHAAPRRRPGWIKHCRLLRLMNGAPSRARVCVWWLWKFVWACTHHTQAVWCVILGLSQSFHHHPANFQPAQNHDFQPEVTLQTTWNNLVVKRQTQKKNRQYHQQQEKNRWFCCFAHQLTVTDWR